MKNNKLSFYFLVLLFSTSITSVMAQDVSIISPFGWCVGPNDPTTGAVATVGNPLGGRYTATAGGSNRLLVAMVILEDNNAANIGNTPTNVTYGGIDLTKVTEAFHNVSGGTDTYISMWILREAGLASAADSNVVVTWSETVGTAPGEVNCAIFGNVDQAQPIRLFASAFNPIGVSVATIETPAIAGNAGDIVLSGVATASTAGTWAWDNGFVSVFTGPGGFGRSLCGTKIGSGSPETAKVTATGTTQARITMVSATIRKRGTLSINDNALASNAINVYPNPASGIVNIDSDLSSTKVINVINSLGQVVSTTKATGNAQIDLKSLKVSGFVIVQVIADGKVSNHKVIVK
jgi:hypothetical protein